MSPPLRSTRGSRIVSVALVGIAAVMATNAASAQSRATARCPDGTVRAIVDGTRRCLATGQPCLRRSDATYHRYGFHCHGGRLTRDLWAPMRRPLELPDLEPGAPCPRLGRIVSPRFGPAIGEYPLYAAGFPDGLVRLIDSDDWGTEDEEWRVEKWIPFRVDAALGPLLVRGRRLDGTDEVRFGRGAQPTREGRYVFERGRIEPSGTRWLRLRAPGCYAVQFDTARFSVVGVFEAQFA